MYHLGSLYIYSYMYKVMSYLYNLIKINKKIKSSLKLPTSIGYEINMIEIKPILKCSSNFIVSLLFL